MNQERLQKLISKKLLWRITVEDVLELVAIFNAEIESRERKAYDNGVQMLINTIYAQAPLMGGVFDPSLLEKLTPEMLKKGFDNYKALPSYLAEEIAKDE